MFAAGFLLFILHMIALVALPVIGALGVQRRPREAGYLFLSIAAVASGLAGGLLFPGDLREIGGMMAAGTVFLFGVMAGEQARTGRLLVPFACRTLAITILPAGVLVAAFALKAGDEFYPALRQILESAIEEAIRFQMLQGTLTEDQAREFRLQQGDQLHVRTLLMPGLFMSGCAAWQVTCMAQFARYSGVWSEETLRAFRWPDWLMVPALLLAAVTGVLGLLDGYWQEYYVALGFLYGFAVLYVAQGMVVVAVFFRSVRIPGWLSWLVLVTLFPVVLGVGVTDLWADYRKRLSGGRSKTGQE